jgi:uncharacterized membrane protein
MPNREPPALYPTTRVDALTDGIYAVAMTLLVLEVRLPDNFDPKNGAQLLQGLIDLWPKLFPYLLSFGVLGLRWLAAVRGRSRAELLGGPYIGWWMFSLLLTTGVPFTTIVVGRYASLAPAVWLYAGNVGLLAIASWWQLKCLPAVDEDNRLRVRQTTTLLLFASAALCIAWSLFDAGHALWAFLLNLAGPAIARRSAIPHQSQVP